MCLVMLFCVISRDGVMLRTVNMSSHMEVLHNVTMSCTSAFCVSVQLRMQSSLGQWATNLFLAGASACVCVSSKVNCVAQGSSR